LTSPTEAVPLWGGSTGKGFPRHCAPGKRTPVGFEFLKAINETGEPGYQTKATWTHIISGESKKKRSNGGPDVNKGRRERAGEIKRGKKLSTCLGRGWPQEVTTHDKSKTGQQATRKGFSRGKGPKFWPQKTNLCFWKREGPLVRW